MITAYSYSPAEFHNRMNSCPVKDVRLILKGGQLHRIILRTGDVALDNAHPVLQPRKRGEGREMYFMIKLICSTKFKVQRKRTM